MALPEVPPVDRRPAVAERAGRYPVGRDIPPFHVLDVVRAAQDLEEAGRRVLHLEVGQPSTPAPATALAAAAKALSTDRLGYTIANGIPSLRERISQHYRARYDFDVDPRRVVLTAGASGGVVLAFLAAFQPGARVAVTEPGYPCYRNTLLAFDRIPVGVPVDSTTRFQPTVELFDGLRASGGRGGGVAFEPDRVHALGRRTARHRGLVRGSGDPAGSRRDLSRHQLRFPTGHGAALQR